jgi:hypothetical protein
LGTSNNRPRNSPPVMRMDIALVTPLLPETQAFDRLLDKCANFRVLIVN